MEEETKVAPRTRWKKNPNWIRHKKTPKDSKVELDIFDSATIPQVPRKRKNDDGQSKKMENFYQKYKK